MAKVVVKLPKFPDAESPQPKPRPSFLSKRWLPAAFVIFVAALVRFPMLDTPNEIIFDEIHYGKHVTGYCCTGSNIFDLHPPHPKLLMALAVRVAGYRGDFNFVKIGTPYDSAFPSFAFRLAPALSGVLAAVSVYWLLALLGVSPLLSTLGGFLVAIDNALIVQTRAGLLDGFLVAFEMLALCLYLKSRRVPKFGRWAFAAGMAAGMATGTKFSGLLVVGMIGIHLLYSVLAKPCLISPRLFGRYVMILCSGFTVLYLGGWWVHFELLKQPGFGDKFYQNTGNFFEDTVMIHKRMYVSNYSISSKHPDGSPWYTWPMMKIPPFYWNKASRAIYLVGNPVIWWGSFLILCVTVYYIYQRRARYRLPGDRELTLKWFHISYLLALFPFSGLGRIFFMYHYFTPLIIALIAGIYWWDGRTRRVGFDAKKHQKHVAWVAGVAVLFGVLVSPVTYGFSVKAWTPKLIKLIRSGRPVKKPTRP